MNAMRCAAWAMAMGAGAAIHAWAQGPLAPPAAPGPMMKTLEQLEPRIPITNTSYVINQPGSYYLTTNLTATGHGITIRTNGVVLDLMGFAITGDGGTTDCGIYIAGTNTAPICGAVVRNGTLRNVGYGFRANSTHGGRFERLALSGNAVAGVWFYCANGSSRGNVFSDCAIVANGGYGIFLNGSASGGTCQGNTLSGCVVVGNSDIGILVSGSPAGTCDGNAVVDCVVNDNVGNGIHVVLARGNRVEGNHVTYNYGASYGLSCVATSSNLFLRNSSIGHVYNYLPGAGDTYGPTVTNQGELATIGQAIHPWANFSR